MACGHVAKLHLALQLLAAQFPTDFLDYFAYPTLMAEGSGLAAFAVSTGSVLPSPNFTAYLLVALAQHTHLSTVIYFMCAWFFLLLLCLLLLLLVLHLHLHVLRAVFCCSCVYFLFIFHFMVRLATVATGHTRCCCFACCTAAVAATICGASPEHHLRH